MYKRTFWGFSFLALLVGLSIWLLAKVPIQLGIDLQGGTELTYALDLSRIEADRSTVAEEVKDVISKRLNAFGLKEISISVQGQEELVIQLPGTDAQSVAELKNQIERAGNLTFRLVATEEETPEKTAQYEAEWQAYLVADREWVERKLADPGFAERRPQPPRHIVRSLVKKKEVGNREEFEPVRKHVLENFHSHYDEKTNTWVPEGIVSGQYLDRVNPTIDQNTFRPAVAFEFTGEGAAQFSDLTRANVGRLLAILLDDDVMQVATIKEQITSAGQLSGTFTDEEVKGIITILRGGSLRTQPILISETTVGSVLGQDSIESGMRAVLIGLAGVMLIMTIYYMVGGLVANCALMLNLLFILAFVVCFRQTLTLPGIAGILLTLGMAVDANILIFERFREERKKGKPFGPSLAAGYNRAFWVIFDSNLTTLITAYVLFYMGTGPVKGFAITLISGIFASFFTSVFVTRLLLSALGRWGIVKDIKMFEAFDTPRIPFTAYQRFFTLGSVVLIALTWSLVIWRGMSNYGIDFTGGARITMNLSRPVTIDAMREKIAGLARERPELFRDYSVQTLRAEEGQARTFAILTRAGSGSGVVRGEEKAPDPEEKVPGADAKAPGPEAKAPGSEAKAAGAAEKPAEKPAETSPSPAPEAAQPPPAEPRPAAPGEPQPPPPGQQPAGRVITGPGEEIRAAEPSKPAEEAAQQVRKVLEEMLRKEGWLVPPAFPRSDWEPVTTPGTAPGIVRLVLEVNLLNAESVTPENLKRSLAAALDRDRLFTTKGRAETATYKGIDVESVELIERPSETNPTARYRIRTTPFLPSIPSMGADRSVPSRNQLEEAIRRFFTDQSQNTFVLSEPFSEVTTVGPSVAESLQADALVALFIGILGIIFYMSLRFEFIYGLAGIFALIHDVLVAVGVMALTDMLFPTTFPVKLNLNELAAILTIIGFSINDTIVLFDRIRENVGLLAKRRITLEDNVNISINQTLSRTLWTSTTVLLVVVILIAFGGESIRGFAFLFAVGTVSGVYSTVFIASPLVLWLFRRAAARREAALAAEAAGELPRSDRRR